VPAQQRYIRSILSTFATFLANADIGQLAKESGIPETRLNIAVQELLVEFLRWKSEYSIWSAEEIEQFSQESSLSAIQLTTLPLLIQFVNEYPPHQTNVFLQEFLLALKKDGCSNSTVKNYRSDISQFIDFCDENEIESLLTKTKLDNFYRYQKENKLKDSTIKRKMSSIVQFGIWLKAEAIIAQPPEWLKAGFVYEALEKNRSWTAGKVLASSSLPQEEARLRASLERERSEKIDLAQKKLTTPSGVVSGGLLSRIFKRVANSSLTSSLILHKQKPDVKKDWSWTAGESNPFAQNDKSKFGPTAAHDSLNINKKTDINRIKKPTAPAGTVGNGGSLFDFKSVTNSDLSLSNILSKKSSLVNSKTQVKSITPTPGKRNLLSLANMPVSSVEAHPASGSPLKHQEKRAQLKSSLGGLSEQIRTRIADTFEQVKQKASLNILPYVNLALIVLFFLGLGSLGYSQLITNAPYNLAYSTQPTPPGRTLSFQGRLTDQGQNPITTNTAMTFRLYNVLTGGTALWTSSGCTVEPDQDGIFAVGLGDLVECGPAISSDIFSENPNIWLEVQVDTETLSPRQPIRTVAYALNAETLQGYPLAPTGGAEANTVVTMNNDSVVLFSEAVVLETATGSNADIKLAADGTGLVNLDDLLYVSSSAGGVGIGTTNPGTAILSVMTGNVGIGTTAPNANLQVVGTFSLTSGATVDNIRTAVRAVGVADDTSLVTEAAIASAVGASASKWEVTTGYLTPNASYASNVGVPSGKLAVGYGSVGASGTAAFSGNVGVGTTNPSMKLDLDSGYSTANSTFRTGTFELQPYGLNNAFLFENAYYDGGWRKRNAGYAEGFQFYNGQTLFMNHVSGTSGSFSATYPFKTDSANSGSVALGGNISVTTGNYSGATMTVLGTGNVGIGTTSPTRILGVGGNAARAIGLERHTTANTAGNNLTLNAGGATSGATNKAGGNLILTSGISTGTGSSNIYFQTALAGTTGTTDRDPTTKMTILGDGNVGIGMTNPSVKLDVASSARISGTGGIVDFNIGSINYSDWTGEGSYLLYNFTTKEGYMGTVDIGNSWRPFNFSASIIKFNTSGGTPNESMRIDSTGNVGIGTTSPSQLFHVNGGTGIVGQFSGRVIGADAVNSDEFVTLSQLIGGTGQYWQRNSTLLSPSIITDAVSVGSTTPASAMLYVPGTTNNNAWFNLGTGNLGVGTTSPAKKFQVSENYNNATPAVIYGQKISMSWGGSITTGSPSYGYGLLFGDNNAEGSSIVNYRENIGVDNDNAIAFFTREHTAGLREVVRINSDGNVGISTTTPAQRLDVSGNAQFSGALMPAGNAGITTYVLSSTGSGNAPTWVDPSTLGTNYWQKNSNVLSPVTITDAVSVGSTTPTSALFYVPGTINNDAWFNLGTGRLGIGVTNPSYSLHVLDSTYSSKYYTPGVTADAATWSGYRVGASYAGHLQSGINSSADMILTQNAYVNRISSNADYKWTTTHASFGSRSIQMGYQSGISFYADSVASTANASFTPTERMRITNAGNVGIGITNPSSKLQLYSNTAGVNEVIKVESHNFAGLELIGDRTNATGEPGGAYVLLSQDNSIVQGIFGIVNIAGFDGSGVAYTDTLNHSLLLGHRYDAPLQLGTNSTVKMTILGNGNVGIGVTNPSQKLDVSGSAYISNYLGVGVAPDSTYRIYANGAAYGIRAHGSTMGGRFEDSNATSVVYAAYGNYGIYQGTGTLNYFLGNVGIGTRSTTPESKLHVKGATGGDSTWKEGIIIENTNATPGEPALSFKNNSTGSNYWITGLNQSAHYDIAYGTTYTNANTLLRIQNNDGNVGIGTVSPTKKLHVNGDIRANVYYDTTGSDEYYLDLNNSDRAFSLAGSASIGGYSVNTSTTKLSVMDGNVGIRTTSAEAPLHTIAYTTGDQALFQKWSYSTAAPDQYRLNLKQTVTSGVVRYTFDLRNNNTNYDNMLTFDRGNVGIGVTSPGYKLDVSGTAHITGLSTLDSNLVFTQGSSARNIGVVGTYSPNSLASIWSMGAAYQLTSAGGAGNLYGLSYSYEPNYGGAGNNPGAIAGLGHQMQWRAKGTTQTAIGTGIYTIGNVGIGTTASRGKLDIGAAGDAYLTHNTLQSGSNNLFLPGHIFMAPFSTGDIVYLQARRSDSSGSTSLRLRTYNAGTLVETMHLASNGNVGIGTTNPTVFLHAKKDQNSWTAMNFDNGTDGTNATSSISARIGSNNYSTAITTYSNSHSSTLAGKGNLTSYAPNGLRIATSGGIGESIEFGHNYMSNTITMILTGGNLGIGTTNPGNKLDIGSGSVRVQSIANCATVGTSGNGDLECRYIGLPTITGGLSSYTSNDLCHPSYVNNYCNGSLFEIADRNTNSGWYPADFNVYAQLDFGQRYNATSTIPAGIQIMLNWDTAYGTCGLDVSTSLDGTTWTTILDNYALSTAYNLAWFTTTTTTSFRYLRVGAGSSVGGDSCGWLGVREIGVGGNSYADIAERYLTTETLTAGNIVSIKRQGGDKYEVTKEHVDPSQILGIITTSPHTLMGDSTQELGKEPADVALAGRVPAIVTTLDGQLLNGDRITSSTIAGLGAKATKAGETVGKTLESTSHWNENNCPIALSIDTINWPQDDGTNQTKPCYRVPVSSLDSLSQTKLTQEYGLEASDFFYVGKVMTFVNVSWYDPDVYLESVGGINQLSSAPTSSSLLDAAILETLDYSVRDASTNTTVTRLGNFAEVAIGKINAGLTKTSSLIAENAVIARAKIADLSTSTLQATKATIDELTTRSIKLGNFELKEVGGKLQIINQNSQTVATIDQDGNTQIEGELTTTAVTSTKPIENTTSPLGELIAQDVHTTNLTATGSTQLAELMTDSVETDSLTVTGTSQLGELIATNIDAETVETNSLIATNLEVTNQLTAQNSRFEQLEAKIAELDEIKATTASIVNGEFETVTTNSLAGNNLNFDQATIKDVTVSGSLYADVIVGFEEKVAQAFRQPSLLGSLLGSSDEYELQQQELVEIIESAGYTATNSNQLRQSLADLNLGADDVAIAPAAAFVNRYLEVNGSAYIADSLAVNNYLVMGDGLKMAATASMASIDYVSNSNPATSTLYLQSSGIGRIDLMAGLMTIDSSGSVIINGDIWIAGNVGIDGALSTNTLLTNLIESNDYDRPTQIRLGAYVDENGNTIYGEVAGDSTENTQLKQSRLEIIDERGAAVATISATGRAEFADGLGIGTEDLSGEAGQEETSVTHKTSGRAKIEAGQQQIIIRSSKVSANSQIFVTPLGSTNNQVLYVKSQVADDPNTSDVEGLFIVGFDASASNDVLFNWWIVN